MQKTYIPPRRPLNRPFPAFVPEKFSCPKCGGRLEDIAGGYACLKCGWHVRIPDGSMGSLKKIVYKSAAFVNGWKTVIGLGMACAGTFFVSGPAGVWLQVAGYAVGGAGGAHKVIKKKNSIKQDKQGGRVNARDWIDLVIDILGRLKAFVEGGES